jgi:hypothetical protein
MQSFEGAELFGDHERGVVGEHDAARPDPECGGGLGEVAIKTAGAELATAGMPWCSATHNRL